MFMESADRLKKAILSTDGNTISLQRIYEFISHILDMDSNELVVQNYHICVKWTFTNSIKANRSVFFVSKIRKDVILRKQKHEKTKGCSPPSVR